MMHGIHGNPRQPPAVETGLAVGDRVSVHGRDGLFGRVLWVGLNTEPVHVRLDDGRRIKVRRHSVHYQPDTIELAQRIEQVRKSWSQRDRHQRNNYKNPPVEICECEVPVRE